AGACAASAAQRDARRGHLPPGPADDPRHGRADHRADARETPGADEILPPLVDELRKLPPERAPVGERRVLELRRAGVRGADEDEDAGALAAACREERVERVASEEWADGERVRERRLAVARLEERGGVR